MAARYDIRLDQGSDVFFPIKLFSEDESPADLKGFSARMQIRPTASSARVLDELSTSNGRITVEGNTITCFFSAAATSRMPGGASVYDLEIQSAAGYITRVLEGAFLLSREVTR